MNINVPKMQHMRHFLGKNEWSIRLLLECEGNKIPRAMNSTASHLPWTLVPQMHPEQATNHAIDCCFLHIVKVKILRSVKLRVDGVNSFFLKANLGFH